MLKSNPSLMPSDSCLPGRPELMPVSGVHAVNGRSYMPPFPEETSSIIFGMGCFWGVERLFWQRPGVHVTAVGYAGGETPNPTYDEVCSGLTNHTEVVLVVYDREKVTLSELLKLFWEDHDPTQGMRQGNDSGSQYRSAIYANSETEIELINNSRDRFQASLNQAGFAEVKTDIGLGKEFFYAEEYHQQYLHKVPNGYCNLAGTGVKY